MKKSIRTRFAPSPTGPLHIGGARTALYNYLFALKYQGNFVLRIEDTDQDRLVPQSEVHILESLDWLELNPHEGLEQGGPFGPYRQSERKDIYQYYVRQLLDAGQAYYAFDTPEELEGLRQRLRAARIVSPKYNALSRDTMQNALTLPESEVRSRIRSGVPYVVRINVSPKDTVRFYDHIRGWIHVRGTDLDDKILMKSDGMPTYHLANVVDDHLMQITHVIRGEEWLPSTPLHQLLYQSFGWDPPEFVHLPLLLNPDGQGKLSKRSAAQQDFPLFPLAWTDPCTQHVLPGFRECGYLPNALCNFLALLGWNPGGTQELWSRAELVKAFSIARINKAGVRFDHQKVKWFNQQYLRRVSDADLAEQYVLPELRSHGITCGKEKVWRVCALMKERVTFGTDIWQQGSYFFEAPEGYPSSALRIRWNEQAKASLQALVKDFEHLEVFNVPNIEAALQQVMRETQSQVMRPLVRIAVTGRTEGPELVLVLDVLGQSSTVQRLRTAIARWSLP